MQSFPDSWSVSYFFYGGEWDTGMFGVFTAGSVVKECNIRRRYETRHAERYRGLQG